MNHHVWVIEIFDPRMAEVGWVSIDSLFHLGVNEDNIPEDIPTTYTTKKEAGFNRKRIVECMKNSLVAIRYRVRKYIRMR